MGTFTYREKGVWHLRHTDGGLGRCLSKSLARLFGLGRWRGRRTRRLPCLTVDQQEPAVPGIQPPQMLLHARGAGADFLRQCHVDGLLDRGGLGKYLRVKRVGLDRPPRVGSASNELEFGGRRKRPLCTPCIDVTLFAPNVGRGMLYASSDLGIGRHFYTYDVLAMALLPLTMPLT